MLVPNIETPRLVIRPFNMNDAAAAHRIGNRCFGDGTLANDGAAIEAHKPMVQWMSLTQHMLAQLHQPPYGDRAVTLRQTNELIGQVGLVPCFDVFDQIQSLSPDGKTSGFAQTEMGLFWAIDPDHQRRGYATEAAQAMIDLVFSGRIDGLRLRRIIATTEHENFASQAVMKKLGMRLEHNPSPKPKWLQVVGVLDNQLSG